jgi:hypothetical protein
VDFRIHSLIHKLSMNGGYVCEGGQPRRVRTNTAVDSKMHSAWATRIEWRKAIAANQRRDAPQSGHRSRKREAIQSGTQGWPCRTTLLLANDLPRSRRNPASGRSGEEEKQLYLNKPIASPFAWHKCGLVVPVYPGMKALLSHNLGLTDDSIVTGFLVPKAELGATEEQGG